jgi:hypothetical protein
MHNNNGFNAMLETSLPPRSSPWGVPQQAIRLAPGIWQVSTSSHGGVYVDRERLSEMPKHLRKGRTQWYEEDCDWVLVYYSFEREMQKGETFAQIAEQTLRNWHPSAYAAHFGVEIETLAGTSYAYDRQQADIRNAEKMVVVAAWGDWCPTVPIGMVGVLAAIGGQRGADETYVLVPHAEYAQRQTGGYVLNGDEALWIGPTR